MKLWSHAVALLLGTAVDCFTPPLQRYVCNESPTSRTRVRDGFQTPLCKKTVLSSKNQNVGWVEKQDFNMLAGDVALLLNNAFAFDAYVVSRRESHGELPAWIFHFLSHIPEYVSHSSALLIIWFTAGIVTNAYRIAESTQKETEAAWQVGAAWIVHLPLVFAFYCIGSSDPSLGLGDTSRFSIQYLGGEVYFNLLFLVAWRVAYLRWKNGLL